MNNRRYRALVALMTLCGGSFFAYAQLGPNDDRRLPYRGHLELNGEGANGPHDIRFGLFSTAAANADCLLTAPATCPLWGEQTSVVVSDGAFSVTLGDDTALSDTVLASDALYLAMAVSGPDDGGVFTLLAGKQEILPVAYAARAAAARDYKVTGELVVGDAAGVHVSITDGAVRAVNSNDTARSVLLADNALRSTGPGGAASPMTLSASTVTVDGDVVVNGAVESQCPSGWDRVGMWCIKDERITNVNYTQALNACHDRGGSICPMAALLACDTLSPSNDCTAATDANVWLWTGEAQGNDVNAFGSLELFNGSGSTSNEIDSGATGDIYNAYCCRYAGGL